MKSQWNKLCESLANYGDLISKTLEFLPPTKQSGRIKKALSKEWEQITKTVGELDLLIDPINPVEISYPFESETFKAVWKYYKDYLVESHNVTMPSRMENMRLTQLYRFSRKEEERAIWILQTLMGNGYKNIICPSEKQITGEEQMPIEEQPANLSINRISQEI